MEELRTSGFSMPHSYVMPTKLGFSAMQQASTPPFAPRKLAKFHRNHAHSLDVELRLPDFQVALYTTTSCPGLSSWLTPVASIGVPLAWACLGHMYCSVWIQVGLLYFPSCRPYMEAYSRGPQALYGERFCKLIFHTVWGSSHDF